MTKKIRFLEWLLLWSNPFIVFSSTTVESFCYCDRKSSEYCPTNHKFVLEDFPNIQQNHPTQWGIHPKTEPSESTAHLARENLPMNLRSANAKVSLEALWISEPELRLLSQGFWYFMLSLSFKFHVNLQNPEKFTKHAKHYKLTILPNTCRYITFETQLLGLFTCRKRTNLLWYFVAATSKQHPKTTRHS